MAPVRFGTDGIRGRAGSDLTTEVAYCLGMAVAEVLGPRRCIVGRDTRESGPLLSAALVAGLGEAGADDPYDVGVLPTPGVAHLCAAQGTIGAVISASHNPFFDNGIKVLGPGGTKLRDDDEAAIEAALARLLDHAIVPSLQPPALLDSAPSAVAEYSDHLVAILPPDALAGMSIVVDCANGAASAVAPEVLRRLGATVHVIGDQPDGQNINDGVGSTHPERLAAEVLRHGAQLGLALDGDADRLIAVDEDGDIVDGDALLCLFALDAKRAGRLAGDGLVVTVMSNLGLHRAMAAAGIEVVTVAVGDRHVASALDERGLILGGVAILAACQVGGLRDDFLRPFVWGPPAAMIVAGALKLEADGRIGTGALARALTAQGDASYSLYLVQAPVIAALAWLTPAWPPLARAPAAVIVALIAGWLAYGLLERPIGLALRRLHSLPDAQRGVRGGLRTAEQETLAAVDTDLA